MPTRPLVLASGSQPRLRLLHAAGFVPEVIPSHVDEDGVDGLGPEKAAVTLAERKALAITERPDVAGRLAAPVVVACDTVVTMDGRVYGKPTSTDQARHWCRQQQGRWVDVVTGQCVVDTASGAHASGAAWTAVEIGHLSDRELEDYLATGEALHAAGALTVDGYGAPFVVGLRGDHGTVVGLSLPLLRDLLGELDISVTALWAPPPGCGA